jgi:hypothetical protein
VLEAVATAEELLPAPGEEKPSGKKEKPGARWAAFTGMCAFVLYALGYLKRRFRLNSAIASSGPQNGSVGRWIFRVRR